MSLKLDLRSATPAPVLGGDLCTFLENPDADYVVRFGPTTRGSLDQTVSASSGLSGWFHFEGSPVWRIPHSGMAISVRPGGECKISIPDQYSIVVALGCMLSRESADAALDVKSTCRVSGSMLLRDALAAAFSSFILPFQVDSVLAMPDGNQIEFDFVENLRLGFGAVCGFSRVSFAGRSRAEVTGTFDSPLGREILKSNWSLPASGGFKATFRMAARYRVAAMRQIDDSFDGIRLSLFRGDTQRGTTSGEHVRVDAQTLQAELGAACEYLLGPPAGQLLNKKFSRTIGDVRGSLIRLLNHQNSQGTTVLEQELSAADENSPLLRLDCDFRKDGLRAYELAMNGDYAAAARLEGVQVGWESLLERLYLRHAGLGLQLSGLSQFREMAKYIQKSDMFPDEQGRTIHIGGYCQDDLLFRSEARLGAKIKLCASWTDRSKDTFLETVRALRQMSAAPLATKLAWHSAANPEGTVHCTIEGDAEIFANVPVDEYWPSGNPPAEPHNHDADNYAAFVSSVAGVMAPSDHYAAIFQTSFRRYADWLAFHRIKTEVREAVKPADRLTEGHMDDVTDQHWPPGFPPPAGDLMGRRAVQAYLQAAQRFMNFCAAVRIRSAATGLQTPDAQTEVCIPERFVKVAMVALLKRTGAKVIMPGELPTPGKVFALTLEVVPAEATARLRSVHSKFGASGQLVREESARRSYYR